MVRFGILGAGNIARRFAASLAHEPRARLVAASCRSAEKAAAFLAGAPSATDARAYGSHDDLLADTEVDAIYLALPHQLHHGWALRALDAGKSVLCEKPAMLNATEMAEVADAARSRGQLFMEAMKPRFVALYPRVMETLEQIGDLRHIEATLCNDMLGAVADSGSYHMTPGPGAGVLLDCGTYCASWIAALAPEPAQLVDAHAELVNGIDVYVDAHYSCGDVSARLECAFDRAQGRRATLVGTRGRIVVEDLHRPQRATLLVDGQEERVLDVAYRVDDFFGEIEHFVGLVEGGVVESPVMSLADSIACARILDLAREGFAG